MRFTIFDLKINCIFVTQPNQILLAMTLLTNSPVFLVSTQQLSVVLIITAVVFIFFIGAAVIKMYRLKKENKKLFESEELKSDVDNAYKDFTDGHLY